MDPLFMTILLESTVYGVIGASGLFFWRSRHGKHLNLVLSVVFLLLVWSISSWFVRLFFSPVTIEDITGPQWHTILIVRFLFLTGPFCIVLGLLHILFRNRQ
ncbi:MAG: hypothetical protein HYW89_03400 [Candidatus Sungiibacteriota bacterium]|uniref:Uncharacterized protein n=1 Tax=Candidatus Sungiibacteriota bacterium TaxID=2750080 RepID=A0A7T5RIZ9_9BACT|nr:MAG: hypothetical protein HYW89_03400 [Candidatus Sungbacteria bacterium]